MDGLDRSTWTTSHRLPRSGPCAPRSSASTTTASALYTVRAQPRFLPARHIRTPSPPARFPDLPCSSSQPPRRDGGGGGWLVSDGAAGFAAVGVRAGDGRHHTRRRPRLLRHAPGRDLVQGDDGGAAAQLRSADAQKGQGCAESAGRGGAERPGPAPAGRVTFTSRACSLFSAVRITQASRAQVSTPFLQK